jgi:hypothetical protein
MGNFSLKRSQWKNAGHALSSEMHEFDLFFGLLAQVMALLIGIFIPQHLLPSILRLATR